MAITSFRRSIVNISVLCAFALISAVALAIASAGSAISRFVGYAFDLLRPEPLRFAAEGWADVSPLGGSALPRSLLNDMRHEAGVSRRSAARHI